jgi:hypothetical protein
VGRELETLLSQSSTNFSIFGVLEASGGETLVAGTFASVVLVTQRDHMEFLEFQTRIQKNQFEKARRQIHFNID